MNKDEKMELFKNAALYPVTSEVHSKGRRDEDILLSIAEAGARVIQLRDKFANKKRFYEKAIYFREITRKYDMLLIINDHLDIALAVDADGVHLGQEDLPIKVARRLAPDLIIGASTHNKEEIVSAQNDGADYINIGPIFTTQTREGHNTFLGIEGLLELKDYAKVPFSVMGGIKAHHIPDLIRAGARIIAMVTEITESDDVSLKTREMLNKIKRTTQSLTNSKNYI